MKFPSLKLSTANKFKIQYFLYCFVVTVAGNGKFGHLSYDYPSNWSHKRNET